MKTQDAYSLITELRDTFAFVRLIDPYECAVWEFCSDGTLSKAGKCFSAWSRSRRCDNCTSYDSCVGRENRDKLEELNGKRYHVVSRCIDIEGKAFALEIVSEISEPAGQTGESDAEKKRRTDEILASGFHTVIEVDLDSQIARPLRCAPGEGARLGVDLSRGETPNAEFFAAFLDKYVLEQDREMLRELGDPEVIRAKLADRDSYSLIFLSDRTGPVHYWELEIKAVPPKPGERLCEVLFCFTDIDSIVRSSDKFHKNVSYALNRAEVYLSALYSQSSGYFRVNLTKKRLITPLIRAENVKNAADNGHLHNWDGASFEHFIERIAERLVIDDVEGFRRFMTAENLIACYEAGNANPEFSCWVHSQEKGEQYLRHLFLIAREANGDIVATCVLYDISAEKREELNKQREAERSIQLIRSLSDSYESIYYVHAHS